MLEYTAPKPLTGKQQRGKGLEVGGGGGEEWRRENRERLGNEAEGWEMEKASRNQSASYTGCDDIF